MGKLRKHEEVTPEMSKAAHNRTQSHIQNLAMIDYDISQLARNCYLQGARDMAESIINQYNNVGAIFDTVIDYQI